MMTFNAADREMCSVRRELTTTPLQALTMMNNVTFVEAARKVAERVQLEGGNRVGDRIGFLFELILSRTPTPREQQAMLKDYRAHKAEFARDEAGVAGLLGVGESSANAGLPSIETATWAMLANTLMNLDEAIATN
jgi:hypothetical protein